MKWPATLGVLVLAGVAGCGNQYRPVINPVVKTGPASQPPSYVAVYSQPDLMQASATATAPPCPSQAYSSPGVITVVDATGDSVAAQATQGNGPLTFALDSDGFNAFSQNCDGTLSVAGISGSLMTKYVSTSTLLQGSAPINALAFPGEQYVVEEGRNAVAAMSGSPPSLKVEITNIAPSVINMTGIPKSQRVYSISQGNTLNSAGNIPWGSCANPSSVSVNGEADGIETTSSSISSRIPLGVCPVYGVTTADGRRSFILNRGSGTISVINDQLNQLDTINASPYLSGTGTINLCNGATPCNAGPVYADFYTPGNLLVVSNYDNDTISVIDTSLDIYGNDSATFGKVLATIPVGPEPAAVSVLQDGTKAYVANEGDGTVTVVSLTSFQPLKTIQLAPVDDPTNPGTMVQPRIRSIASVYNYPAGSVFVAAQNSPYVTVIRTDTDVVSARVLVQGYVVDLHTTVQYATQLRNNTQYDSRSVGSGVP
ncbi:MAG TPA: hypothetical protein VMU92_04055 [Acidobacteriaceae bacterium]|nr:hypothetical protein [Acidobacteriaceae bacterium]